MRKLIYIPKTNTFQFFYSQGDTGRSYSLRDYSEEGVVTVTRYADYQCSDREILERATYEFDAPKHDVNDLPFWHNQTVLLNQRYLQPYSASIKQASILPSPISKLNESHINGNQPQRVLIGGEWVQVKYPILELKQLLAHPTKGQIKRILTSPISEDYLTWNIFRGLHNTPAEEWWSEFIRLVQTDNPNFELRYRTDDLPTLEMWRKYKTPPTYERWSRTRMAQSDNPGWVRRSQNMRAVEGPSEIDLVISGQRYLVFAEAKLQSKINRHTTNDPIRNQMIRNIDAILDKSNAKTPGFLMIVKDQNQDPRHVQLLREYQQNPQALAQALPHRNLETVSHIASNLAILLWKDVLALVQHLPDDVGAELKRRIEN